MSEKILACSFDKYDALQGSTLAKHFNALDILIYKAMGLISQTVPTFLEAHILTPVIIDLIGAGANRRWSSLKSRELLLVRLIEITRLWCEKIIYWEQWIQYINELQFYRQVQKTWIEQSLEYLSPRIKEHILVYLKTYNLIKDQLVKSYIPMVWKIAGKFSLNAKAQYDLFQVGIIGLEKATGRYNNDPTKPVTFPRYAQIWTRQAILHEIRRNQNIINVGHSVLEAESKIRRQELQTGIEDQTDRAQRIKEQMALKNVTLLTEFPDIPEEEKNEVPNIDLRCLSQEARRVLILKFGLFEHAICSVSKEDLEAEGQRQSACR